MGQEIALRSEQNRVLAIMTVEEVYEWDLAETAEKVFGKNDFRHPLVAEMNRWGRLNISGPLRVIQLPVHYDFQQLRLTPRQTRAQLEKFGRKNIVAFQTRNPLHRVHEELTKRATEEIDGVLLLHPVVGLTKPGDVDHFTRVRTYKALASRYYDPDRILLSLLPLAMRMAGPREALWHAIIRRNYGANHLIIGRDHAGPGTDSEGKPFYGPYDAQNLVEAHSEETGVKVIPFRMLVYLPEEERYEEVTNVPEAVRTASISGTQVREEYAERPAITRLVHRPEVAEILAESHPPRYKQGVCIWFTGLSNSGKSTTAAILTTLLQEQGRQVTVLDSDVVHALLRRAGLQQGRRDPTCAAWASSPPDHCATAGVALCAAASPYRGTRNEIRGMVGTDRCGGFVDTPLEVCRDLLMSGLYAKARRGKSPASPALALRVPLTRNQARHCSLHGRGGSRFILDYLMRRGFIAMRTARPGILLIVFCKQGS